MDLDCGTVEYKFKTMVPSKGTENLQFDQDASSRLFTFEYPPFTYFLGSYVITITLNPSSDSSVKTDIFLNINSISPCNDP